MKIYNEVVIDMNPDSPTYGEHLSEDSYKYNGDIALCCGDIETELTGDPQPGYAAAKFEGHKHPSVIPGTYTAGFADVVGGTPGGETIKGISIPTADPGYYQPGGEGGERSKGALHGGQSKKYRARAWEDDVAQAYTDKFHAGWYEPYLKTQFQQPFEAVTKDKFQTLEQAGLGDLSSIPGFGGIKRGVTSAGGYSGLAGSPIIQKGSKVAAEDLEKEYRTQETAYQDEMDRLDEDKALAELVKAESMSDVDRQRLELVRRDLPQAEQLQSNIAKTGMAYSGPAAKRNLAETLERDKALGDFIREKRGIQSDYEGNISKITTGREQAETDFDIAKDEFGQGIRGLVDSASGELQTMLDTMKQFYEGHEQVGEALHPSEEGGYWKTPHDDLKMGYDSFGGWGGPLTDIVGKGGDDAPTGGYFAESETSALPGYDQLYQNIVAAQDFSDWLSKEAKTKDIATAMIPTTTEV